MANAENANEKKKRKSVFGLKNVTIKTNLSRNSCAVKLSSLISILQGPGCAIIASLSVNLKASMGVLLHDYLILKCENKRPRGLDSLLPRHVFLLPDYQ